MHYDALLEFCEIKGLEGVEVDEKLLLDSEFQISHSS